MKRRILLVDDDVAVLLTLKAILEINGFAVETAASAKEAKLKLRGQDFHMVITDMRMENDVAGAEVIRAAKNAPSQPAIAMLTAFPSADEDWREMGADEMLVKPMHTNLLVQQLEALLVAHEDRKQKALSMAALSSKKPVSAKAEPKKLASRK
ncbi:MAG: response regulator [Acidobacteriaceae bacterium]